MAYVALLELQCLLFTGYSVYSWLGRCIGHFPLSQLVIYMHHNKHGTYLELRKLALLPRSQMMQPFRQVTRMPASSGRRPLSNKDSP
jgi:hypothetical protein